METVLSQFFESLPQHDGFAEHRMSSVGPVASSAAKSVSRIRIKDSMVGKPKGVPSSKLQQTQLNNHVWGPP